ncbi:glycosyltransferase [Isoptericola sp. F-RaC21]|uniref:glycosyltransferase n=1 Tax=Isoptericola sp. F-RaC21 TaxID=3141452 RepID=UPI00315C1AC1
MRGPRPPGPLRVLVVGHTAELGGAELALVRLCAALRQDAAGVDVRAALLADGPLVALLEDAGTPVRVVAADPALVTAARGTLTTPSAGALRRVAAAARTVVALRRVVRAARPDVVHTTTLKADVLGLVAAWTCRVPVVWHVHDRVAPDYLPPAVVRVLRAVARRGPRAVVANSRATAATLPGVRDLTVAYPGFAPEQARPAPPGPPSGRPRVVGLLGRLSPTKGQLELVRATPAVLAHHPDVVVRLVGAPAFGAEGYAREVEAEVRRLGLEGRVELAGFAADPAAVLDSLALCVHASPVPEPFGQVVVEAMVRGVPVVATDAGGVPEILRAADPPLGRLVPPGDPQALADAIVAVLDDPRAAHDVAARAHAVALARFSVAETARTVSAVWRRAARPAPARRRRPVPAPPRTA